MVFWKYVNSRRKIKTSVSDLKKTTGGYSANDEEKADILNQQYYNTFTKEDISNMPEMEPREMISSAMSDIEITEEEVYKKLVDLKIDKSPGPDEIHPRLLKEMAKELSGPLTIIFNQSIRNSELPTQWKEATIIPIYKKGNKTDPANYRLVSLTSIVCRIMENALQKDSSAISLQMN